MHKRGAAHRGLVLFCGPMPPASGLVVYVDYDGTITDQDTFAVLARDLVPPARWQQLEDQLAEGSLALREMLSIHASYMRISIAEADAILTQRVAFDASFSDFVAECERHMIPVAVLSSGVAALIACAMGRNGLARVELLASDVAIEPQGWVFRHRDESANGHDKAATVRRAQAAGHKVVFIGDGVSDYAAALAADLRFAKRGRPLEGFLRERQIPFTAFTTFTQVQAALFPPPPASDQS